jgi:hypothetical protein
MSIQKLFDEGTAIASEYLDRARWAASVSLPFVMPEQGFTPGNKLRNPNNSLAARGVVNVVGKLRSVLFPGDGWFELDLEPEQKYNVSPDDYQAIVQALFVEGIKIQAALESSHVKRKRRVIPGFYAQTGISLTQLIVTGSTLEGIGLRGNDDYSKRVFARDQYRTWRDAYGDVWQHTIKECVHPDRLPEDIRAKIEVKDGEREVDVYTLYRRQSDDTWVLTQEINDEQVYEAEHATARLFQTDFKRAGNDHYGRGLIELHAGDFESNEFFAGRMKDWAEHASKFNPVIGTGSTLRPEDLAVESGRIIVGGRVEGGRLADVAMLGVEKLADFQVVSQVWNRCQEDLSKTMLLDADSAPKGEAGRHSTAWKQTAEQLQGWLGDLYSTIADEQQKPLLWAALDMGSRTGLVDSKKVKYAEVVSLTGLSAIDRKRQAEAIIPFAQYLSTLGPEALRVIDTTVAAQMGARALGIKEPGLVKTPARLEQEARKAMADQVKMEGATAAIQESARAAGSIAQQQAAPPA